MKASGKIRRSIARTAEARRRADKHPGAYDKWDRKEYALQTQLPRISQKKPAFLYSAAMANHERGVRRSHQLKRERIAIGWTRREYDRYRFGVACALKIQDQINDHQGH